MFSAVVRKSITDLTRRKARAFFTVLTLALAVASVGIFAVPGADAAGDGARGRRQPAARRDRLDEAAAAQRRASSPRSSGCPTSPRSSRAACSPPASGSASGASAAIVVGVPDYARQRADVVSVDSGAAPRAGDASSPTAATPSRKGFDAAPAPRARARRRRHASARCRSAASAAT